MENVTFVKEVSSFLVLCIETGSARCACARACAVESDYSAAAIMLNNRSNDPSPGIYERTTMYARYSME